MFWKKKPVETTRTKILTILSGLGDLSILFFVYTMLNMVGRFLLYCASKRLYKPDKKPWYVFVYMGTLLLGVLSSMLLIVVTALRSVYVLIKLSGYILRICGVTIRYER